MPRLAVWMLREFFIILSSGALNAGRSSGIIMIERIFLSGWVSLCWKRRRDAMPGHFYRIMFIFFSDGRNSPRHFDEEITDWVCDQFQPRHKRHGHLLQNRYKSIVCQEETYLQELVRYIHLNPLRAKVVPDLSALSRYPYCGHSALMGRRERPWQNVDYVLQTFGKGVGRARREYFYTLRRG